MDQDIVDQGIEAQQDLDIACVYPEGDRGSGSPLKKKHKIIGFLSNTGPDPL